VQYSTNEIAWADLVAETISLVGVGTKVTQFASIPDAAKLDIFIRIVTAGGNAVDDPQIRGAWIQAT